MGQGSGEVRIRGKEWLWRGVKDSFLSWPDPQGFGMVEVVKPHKQRGSE